MMTSTARFGLLFALLALSACGFQLRGTGTDGGTYRLDTPIAIAGLPPYGPMARALRQALDAAGASVDGARGAAAVLQVSSHDSTRRILSVDRRNKAVEYELEEALTFRVSGADGTARVPRQSVRTLRILYDPDTETLGRGNEEELLREDMRRELADRVLQRLGSQF
jgi:LPS-assembly lipoprotein